MENKTIYSIGCIFKFSANYTEDGIYIKSTFWLDYTPLKRILWFLEDYFFYLIPILAGVIVLPYTFYAYSINFYNVTFSLATVGIIIAMIKKLKWQIGESRYYSFILDEFGVKYSTKNFNFYLAWEEISSYGLVSDIQYCLSSGSHTKGDCCMYFTSENLSKRKLRGVLTKFANYEFMHKSVRDKKIIAFSFSHGSDELEIYESFKKYVQRYCPDAEEINYYLDI